MNWISNVVRPEIRSILGAARCRRTSASSVRRPASSVFYKDVEANQFVIPGSNYHMRMSAAARLKSIFDNETVVVSPGRRCRPIR